MAPRDVYQPICLPDHYLTVTVVFVSSCPPRHLDVSYGQQEPCRAFCREEWPNCVGGSDTRQLPQELILLDEWVCWVHLVLLPRWLELPNEKATCIGWKTIETLSLIGRVQFYFLELHFCGFVLRRDLMLLIVSHGAKERLGFMHKFSATGHMLTTVITKGDKGLLGGKMCVGGEQIHLQVT